MEMMQALSPEGVSEELKLASASPVTYTYPFWRARERKKRRKERKELSTE